MLAAPPTAAMPATKPKAKESRRARDNFSQSVISILFKRAGGKCCRCFAPTFGPVSNNPAKSVNIGQGAHIAAAAPGGPRYDPKMTPEERASAANGMWMCSNCHDIIDRDVEAYPMATLKKMKKDAERKAKREMGVGTFTGGSEALSVGVSASTIVEVRKAKAEILALNGRAIDNAQGEELLAMVSFINPDVDRYLPEVGTEIIDYFDQLVAHCNEPAIVLEVLRRLKILADTFNTQWKESDVEQVSRVSKRVLERAKSKRSRLYQCGTALLKDLSMYSAIREKGFHKIPIKSMKDLRGVDLTDSGPSDAKRMKIDTEEASGPPPVEGEEAGGPPPVRDVGDEDRYLDLMEKLSMCKPEEEEAIEEKLMSMGYEPNIV